MDYLSLFSGGLGGDLAMQHLLGFRCKGYVEIDDFCQKLIRQRQEDGLIHRAPIFGDIRAFIDSGYARSYQGMVDGITAGIPCQPHSFEGNREGENDPRNLWPETLEAIKIIQPKWFLLENVSGISRYLPVVIRDLRRAGYTVKRPQTLSSGSSGALQIRKRIWLFAYNDSRGWVGERNELPSPPRIRMQTWPEFEGLVQDILQSCIPASKGNGIHDAVARRMDRLKATGNGQDPIVAATAYRLLSEGII